MNNTIVLSELTHESVNQDTWGHLAPKLRTKYKGYVLFALTMDGDAVLLDYDFIDLPDSPWFYSDLCEFISSKAVADYVLYRFDGTYLKCKNGAAKFSGKTSRIKLGSSVRINLGSNKS